MEDPELTGLNVFAPRPDQSLMLDRIAVRIDAHGSGSDVGIGARLLRRPLRAAQ